MTTLPGNGSAGDERDGNTPETAADTGSLDATASETADLPLNDDGDSLVLDPGDDGAASADSETDAPAESVPTVSVATEAESPIAAGSGNADNSAATDRGASTYASAPYRPEPYAPAVTPRVRSGAIAWGVIVVLAAVAVLLVQLNPAAAAAYASWQASLTLGTVALLGVVAVGALVLLFAALSAIRHAQRRARGETR